jgi:site-specific DNA-methyltransferase (cytosine-N4-specific)
LRAVSWQKDDDLRVRKEVIAVAKGEVTARFSEEARRSTKMLVAYLSQAGRKKIGKHTVYEADARTAKVTLRALTGKVDAIITSPPYATALPYLDTDRLSLIYLKLLPRGEHRSRDVMMIGNREISGRIKEAYWATYERDRKLLPSQTRSLIERIDRLNKSANVGFRRRNLSALLSKYFFDMRSVLIEQRGLLKSRGTLFMVVGNNRTTAGGKEIEIQTTEHLARIAASVGFRVAGKLPMEMLRSRDIFRKNAMPSEEILTLQKA